MIGATAEYSSCSRDGRNERTSARAAGDVTPGVIVADATDTEGTTFTLAPRRSVPSMRMVVTSASGANGNGRGTLLAFDRNGQPLGPFAPDAGIADPRGLHVHPDGRHLYMNNGDDRVLLLDERGAVVASTAPIERLNPGGGVISPDGRYCVTARTLRTIVAFSADLGGPGTPLLPDDVVAFPRGFGFANSFVLWRAREYSRRRPKTAVRLRPRIAFPHGARAVAAAA